jgi:hypothetical protein
MARFGLAALAASAMLFAGVSTAGAATVDNPGPFTATFDGGELNVLDDSATIPITPALPVTLAGTIDQDGNISVPASGLTFPVFHAEPIPGLTIDVQLISDGASGTLNPSTGAATLTARAHVAATLAGLVNDTCRAGTSAAPLALPLTTGSSDALTGVPYSATDGSATLVDTFTLGAIHCDNPANDPTAAALSGMLNKLTLSGRMSPVIKPFVAQQAPPVDTSGDPQQQQTPAPQQTQPSQQQPQGQVQVSPHAPTTRCTVPKLKGLTLAKAKSALSKAHCKTGKVTKKKSSAKKGTVIAASPKTGAKVAAGTKVALTISDGPPKRKKRR